MRSFYGCYQISLYARGFASRADVGPGEYSGQLDSVFFARASSYRICRNQQVTPLATKAEGWPFCYPDDVAIDSSGNVYMTDLTYSGIWEISPDV